MTRLVIAPHVDDDVLGCASLLDASTITFYCGVDAHHEVSQWERLREAQAVAEATGGMFYWPTPMLATESLVGAGALIEGRACSAYRTDRTVNRYDVQSLIHDFERVINRHQPDEVLIPWPSYNQDHRAVYEAAMVALRPHDRNHFVPRVLVYEGSQINFWDHAQPGRPFQPTYFVPINASRKIEMYEMMASQVRSFRSTRHLMALATLRGGEIGVPYAEGFEVLRWVGSAS